MDTNAIKDSIIVNCSVSRAFEHFTSAQLLRGWWPKYTTLKPEVGGALTMIWFDGGTMQTSFDVFELDRRIGFEFYTERIDVAFAASPTGALISIVHSIPPGESQIETAIHVARSWGFLLANLKSVIEHGYDLRPIG
jgi:uncharacterized protein YndB with AHSA1/START domain